MVYNPIVLVGTRGAQIRINYVNKQTGAQSIDDVNESRKWPGPHCHDNKRDRIRLPHPQVVRHERPAELDIVCAQIMMYRSNTELFLEKLRDEKKE